MDTLRDRLKTEIDRPAINKVDPRAGMAAILLVAILAAGVGFTIYRRRRLSFAKRIQHAMPDVNAVRASIKRPLERVVEAL